MDRRSILRLFGFIGLGGLSGCINPPIIEDNFRSGDISCTHKPYSPPEDTYPMYKYDSQCSANPPKSQAPTNFPLRQKWKYPTNQKRTLTPICGKDTIYTTASNGLNSTLITLNPKSGREKWKNNKNASIGGPPTIDKDHIYIYYRYNPDTNNQSGLYKINKNNKETIWKKSLGVVDTPITLGENTIYTGYTKQGNNDLFGVSLNKSGDICWRYKIDEELTQITGIARTQKYTVLTAAQIEHIDNQKEIPYHYTVYVLDGEGLVWKEQIYQPADIALTSEFVIVGSPRGTYGFNLDSGEQIWSVDSRLFPESYISNQIALMDGIAYIGGLEGLKAVDIESGEILWDNLDGIVGPVASGDYIYYTETLNNQDNNVGALNTQGDITTNIPIKDDTRMLSSPSLAHNTLYFGTENEGVYAYQ